jgi:radical SAM superfamily enzyme YgiQ (UPF0313 family)
MPKAINKIEQLESALKKIKKMGILIHASMIFGFDNDKKEIFNESVRFLIKNRVSTASFNVLTPYPGTKVYEDLKNENRLITTDWRYYDQNTVVFRTRKNKCKAKVLQPIVISKQGIRQFVPPGVILCSELRAYETGKG